MQQAIIAANAGDSAFVIAAGFIAIGFGAVGAGAYCSGRVSPRQRGSIMLQNASVAAAAALAWIIAGYSIGFGTDSNGWFGQIALGMGLNANSVRAGTALPESAFAMFRLGFAMIAAALLAGAWAGRARLAWAVVFAAAWSLIVFAPIAHWLWGGGWLRSQFGAIDYAGGLVVHTSAGVSALVIAVLMGPRDGFVKDAPDKASSAPTMLGAGLLFTALLALNGASALSANHNAAAAIVSVVAAGGAGALAWLALDNSGGAGASAGGFAKGLLAGLAAIAPASVYVSPLAAIVIGIVCGAACFAADRWTRRSLGVDDAASVFALSGAGGILGSLLLAVFLSQSLGGTGYFGASTMLSQLTAQSIAAGAVAVWSAVGTALAALAVSVVFPMRADDC